MYPDLFERNVNGFTVSTTSTAQGSPGSSARIRIFDNSLFYPVGPATARRSEARVRCRFMAKPATRENYRPGFRQGSPTGDGCKPSRHWSVACTFRVIAANAAALIKMAIILVLATAASVQGDGEFNPVTLLTNFCR
jgi:hypothetical protein